MRLLEIGYATIRYWLCDYAKLVVRLFEIGYATIRNEKGMYSYRKSTSRYIVMIKILVRGYYEYLRIIPGLILIFLRIWLSLQIWSMLTPRFLEMTERVSPLATL